MAAAPKLVGSKGSPFHPPFTPKARCTRHKGVKHKGDNSVKWSPTLFGTLLGLGLLDGPAIPAFKLEQPGSQKKR